MDLQGLGVGLEGLGGKISGEKKISLFLEQFNSQHDSCRLSQFPVLMAIFLSCFFQIWNVRMCLY